MYIFLFQISLPFLIRLIRSSISNSSSEGISHKYPESGVCTAVALSFYGFFLPHAVVVTVRLVLDMKGENLPAYEAWMMKVRSHLCYTKLRLKARRLIAHTA